MKGKPRHPRHESQALTARLQAESRKLTGPRRALLRLLEASTHPLSIREMHEALKEEECDLATVYRSMHLLEQIGLVQRFDFGDAIARFELSHRHGHHHHLICRGCARVVEIHECFPAELEKKIAAGNGFASISHKLEFFGVCPSCQAKAE